VGSEKLNRILIAYPERRDNLGYLGMDRSVMLKYVLKK
jgi:hypothetical protein